MEQQALFKVKNFIKENKLISNGDRIIVGLSGGADSVCLLCILKDIQNSISFSLEAIHVHHGIRGQEADEDEQFAKNLCEQLQVPFTSYHRNIPYEASQNHESEEECGRRIRYEIFNHEASKVENSKIAVAHHMDDQAETILFRILRGTGLKGIAGIKAQNGNIIRPLLCINKEEILEYLKGLGQSYKLDCTNEDTNYSRNYIRKEILPLFNKINENSVSHILALSQEALEVESYLEEEADEVLKEALAEERKCSSNDFQGTCRKYKVEKIIKAKPVLRGRIIRRIIASEGLSLKDISRDHIAKINGILEKSESAEVHLPKGAKIKQEAGLVFVEKEKEDSKDFCIQINHEGSYIIEGSGEIKCRYLTDFSMDCIPQSAYTKWFDYDKIIDGLCVRNRRPGDFLIINHEGRAKSLKDYMINEKIPKSERDRIPLIASQNRICWVIGHRISEDAKVTDKTSRVIEIRFIKEKDHG